MSRRPFPAIAAIASLSAALAMVLSACGFGGPEESPGRKVPASLTWLSTTLRKPAAVKSASAMPSIRVDTGDTYLSYRITPQNMEGRLIQAGLMVGVAGSGGGASRLGLMGPENGYPAPTVPDSRELPHFNMADRPTFASDFRCCWSSYPGDDRAYSGWFEIMFAYVDVTFAIPSGPLAGTHTVRTAFADIGDLGYRRGDLLYRTGEGFRWVDSATGDLAADRPANPLALGWVSGYSGSGDGRGNQHIPVLFVAIQDSQRVHMPADTVLANAWEFVADFILTGGLIFRRHDPAAMTRPAELLAAFDFRADRDNASAGADGITSNFYALRTPLDQPRPSDFKDSLGNWILPPADSLDSP